MYINIKCKVYMSNILSFSTPPSIPVGFAKALLIRRRGLSEGQPLERFEASMGDTSINPGLLRRYVKLCGFEPGPALPVTYPHVLAVPLHLAMLTQRSFPLPTLGLVHVAQRIEQLQPIPVDAPIAFRCYLQGVSPARSGVTFDLHTEVSVGSELYWRGVTTTLCRTRTNRGQPPHREVAAPPRPGLAVQTWHVPEDLGRRYAAVAGDRNPIHLYAWTAKMFGFKRAIIHGMWSMARAAAELVQGEQVEMHTDFRRPIFLPSKVDFVHEPQDDGELRFALWRPGTDKLHLSGMIRQR